MNQTESRRNRVRILIVLLILILLFGLWYIFSPKEASNKSWNGSWDVTYFYENEPSLAYHGQLEMQTTDGLAGRLEIMPPLGTKPEVIELQNLSTSSDGLQLSGEIVHDRYKIRTGHLRESFTFNLIDKQAFEGIGSCIEFCAEGTDDIRIRWVGNK
jgi:hypothetical protein